MISRSGSCYIASHMADHGPWAQPGRGAAASSSMTMDSVGLHDPYTVFKINGRSIRGRISLMTIKECGDEKN